MSIYPFIVLLVGNLIGLGIYLLAKQKKQKKIAMIYVMITACLAATALFFYWKAGTSRVTGGLEIVSMLAFICLYFKFILDKWAESK